MSLLLRKTTVEDLETLFVFQKDEQANEVAAFNVEHPEDKEAYIDKWTKIVNNPTINMQTVFLQGELVASVIHFDMMGETNVSYWVDRQHWGKGIASTALGIFLKDVHNKKLHARVAFDNIGSQKVLEKNGFMCVGQEQGHSYVRGKEIEEFIYTLEV